MPPALPGTRALGVHGAESALGPVHVPPMLHILGRGPQQSRIVAKRPEPAVARDAKEAAQHHRLMTMIEAESPVGFLLADGTDAVLLFQLSIVLVDDRRIVSLPAPILQPKVHALARAILGIAVVPFLRDIVEMFAVRFIPGDIVRDALGPIIRIFGVSFPVPF